MTNLDPAYELAVKQSAHQSKEAIHALCEEVRRLESVIADAAVAINPCAHEGEDLLTIVRDTMADYKALIMSHADLKHIHAKLKAQVEGVALGVLEPPAPIKIEPFAREECIYHYCYDPSMCQVKCKAPRGA